MNMTARRPIRTAIAVAAVLVSTGCHGGSHEGWSSRARTMVLTSGPSEIVMSSSKVPGYWARPSDAEDPFFLFTPALAFKKGDRVTVEGPFGPATPSVFHEETGEYRRYSWRPVFVLVVWKIGRTDNAPRP
jgi:hypothetical protein